MCYSPGSEICTRCNPGYQLQSDNTCIRIGNYMGQTTQLQDNTYTVNKPSWGNKLFNWKMKTSNKQPGSGWNPSINQPTNDICLEKKGRLINWAGPLLAGHMLIISGSHGLIASISPYTGKYLGAINVKAPVDNQAIVANETVYFLTAEGDLLAYK